MRAGLGVTGWISVAWLAVVAAAIVASALGLPGDPAATDPAAARQWISAAHPLGTDSVGRDLLARLSAGAAQTVGVAGLAVLAAALAGTLLGLLAGLGGRVLTGVVQRATEVLMAFPELLLALLAVAVIGPGLVSIGLGIAIAGIPAYLRLAAATSSQLARSGAVEAALVLDVSRPRAIVRHVVPSTLESISVLATIGFGTAVASAAGLGFLGLGIDSDSPEWGFLVSLGRGEFPDAWWIATFPALAIALTVAAATVLGRRVRRAFGEQHAPAPARRRRGRDLGADDGQRVSESAPLLSVVNLVVSAPRMSHPLVEGVTFDVHAGECVALVGESGAGKSVTARALLGLAPGRVRATRLQVDGTDARSLGEGAWRRLRGRRIALVAQDALGALDPLRRIGDDVVEAAVVHGLAPRGRQSRRRLAVTLLQWMGLDGAEWRARRYPHELSGGQRQRAVLAAALSGRPSILVADEPTTALDAAVQRRVLERLDRLRAEGRGIVLVSHDLRLVSRSADRVLVLHDGAVVEQGTVTDVLERPQHPYTRELLGAALLGSPAPPPVDAPEVLTASGIVVRRRGAAGVRRVLDGVDLRVHRGETVGIVGASGAGKTTLARVLLGLERPHAGVVSRQGRVRAVDQHPLASMDARWTVRRIVAEGLPRGLDDRSRAQRVDGLLGRVGLDAALASARPRRLSGGQRQRVAIARALAGDPEVLVCDEPTSALDATVQRRVLELLESLQRERGLAIVLISHDPAVVDRLAHRTLRLDPAPTPDPALRG